MFQGLLNLGIVRKVTSIQFSRNNNPIINSMPHRKRWYNYYELWRHNLSK